LEFDGRICENEKSPFNSFGMFAELIPHRKNITNMASNPDILNEDPSIEREDGLLKRKLPANLTKLPFKQPASKYDFVKVVM
jgi:hypothetical protein